MTLERHILYIIPILFIICIFTIPPYPSYAADAVVALGHTAPDFTLPNLDGVEYTLSAHKGEHKATLILVWGVWCPYCRAIMVMLKKEYAQLRAKGMEVVSISIRENPRKIAMFTKKLNPGFVVLTDEWGDLKESYKIKDVPRVVLLDKNHKVEAMAITTSAEMIRKMITTALRK